MSKRLRAKPKSKGSTNSGSSGRPVTIKDYNKFKSKQAFEKNDVKILVNSIGSGMGSSGSLMTPLSMSAQIFSVLFWQLNYSNKLP